MAIRFVWDPRKSEANRRKHGVAFEEAAAVFTNLPLRVYYDPDHSASEDRYIAVGFSTRARALLVVHCENTTGTVIRIISARRASRREVVAAFGGER